MSNFDWTWPQDVEYLNRTSFFGGRSWFRRLHRRSCTPWCHLENVRGSSQTRSGWEGSTPSSTLAQNRNPCREKLFQNQGTNEGTQTSDRLWGSSMSEYRGMLVSQKIILWDFVRPQVLYCEEHIGEKSSHWPLGFQGRRKFRNGNGHHHADGWHLYTWVQVLFRQNVKSATPARS